MNADPQPWYTPSLPNLFLLIFFPFSIHSYLYSYLPPAILTLPSSLLTLTSCVRTYFSPYPLIFDLHSILTYIHSISFTLSFLASTLSILNLISCQPFLHSSLLTYLPSILTYFHWIHFNLFLPLSITYYGTLLPSPPSILTTHSIPLTPPLIPPLTYVYNILPVTPSILSFTPSTAYLPLPQTYLFYLHSPHLYCTYLHPIRLHTRQTVKKNWRRPVFVTAPGGIPPHE